MSNISTEKVMHEARRSSAMSFLLVFAFLLAGSSAIYQGTASPSGDLVLSYGFAFICAASWIGASALRERRLVHVLKCMKRDSQCEE